MEGFMTGDGLVALRTFLENRCGSLSAAFATLDAYGVGRITSDGFSKGLQRLGYTGVDLSSLFRQLDVHGEGLLDQQSFVSGLNGQQTAPLSGRLDSLQTLEREPPQNEDLPHVESSNNSNSNSNNNSNNSSNSRSSSREPPSGPKSSSLTHSRTRSTPDQGPAHRENSETGPRISVGGGPGKGQHGMTLSRSLDSLSVASSSAHAWSSAHVPRLGSDGLAVRPPRSRRLTRAGFGSFGGSPTSTVNEDFTERLGRLEDQIANLDQTGSVTAVDNPVARAMAEQLDNLRQQLACEREQRGAELSAFRVAIENYHQYTESSLESMKVALQEQFEQQAQQERKEHDQEIDRLRTRVEELASTNVSLDSTRVVEIKQSGEDKDMLRMQEQLSSFEQRLVSLEAAYVSVNSSGDSAGGPNDKKMDRLTEDLPIVDSLRNEVAQLRKELRQQLQDSRRERSEGALRRLPELEKEVTALKEDVRKDVAALQLRLRERSSPSSKTPNAVPPLPLPGSTSSLTMEGASCTLSDSSLSEDGIKEATVTEAPTSQVPAFGDRKHIEDIVHIEVHNVKQEFFSALERERVRSRQQVRETEQHFSTRLDAEVSVLSDSLLNVTNKLQELKSAVAKEKDSSYNELRETSRTLRAELGRVAAAAEVRGQDLSLVLQGVQAEVKGMSSQEKDLQAVLVDVASCQQRLSVLEASGTDIGLEDRLAAAELGLSRLATNLRSMSDDWEQVKSGQNEKLQQLVDLCSRGGDTASEGANNGASGMVNALQEESLGSGSSCRYFGEEAPRLLGSKAFNDMHEDKVVLTTIGRSRSCNATLGGEETEEQAILAALREENLRLREANVEIREKAVKTPTEELTTSMAREPTLGMSPVPSNIPTRSRMVTTAPLTLQATALAPRTINVYRIGPNPTASSPPAAAFQRPIGFRYNSVVFQNRNC